MEIVFKLTSAEQQFLRECIERGGSYSMDTTSSPSNKDEPFRIRWQKQIETFKENGLIEQLHAQTQHSYKVYGLSKVGKIAARQYDPHTLLKNFLETPFTKANFPMLHGMTLGILSQADINTPHDLLQKSVAELRAIRRCGPGRIDDLKKMLASYNLSIKEN